MSGLSCPTCPVPSYVAASPKLKFSEQAEYGHAYVISQVDPSQQSDIPPADAAISYWPTAQVPATGPVSTTPQVDSRYYFPSQSYYGNHDLSSTELHSHAAPVNQFQSIPEEYVGSYGAAAYPDASPPNSTATAVQGAAPAIPAYCPLPTIAPHQSESGHDLMPQDATAHSALDEVSTH